MSKLSICSVKGEQLGEVEIADGLLESKRGKQAVQDVVKAYRAASRAGTAATKKRGMVSGGGRKPYKQKGTGRARAGSIRSPIWKGGGTIFGPHPRSYAQKINKQTQRLALRRAVSDKIAAGAVQVVDQFALEGPKTKALAALLKQLKMQDTPVLIVLGQVDRNARLAARNLPRVEVSAAADVHTYQWVRYGKIILDRAALPELEKRLSGAQGSAS